jgi:hypothetical protein
MYPSDRFERCKFTYTYSRSVLLPESNFLRILNGKNDRVIRSDIARLIPKWTNKRYKGLVNANNRDESLISGLDFHNMRVHTSERTSCNSEPLSEGKMTSLFNI